MACGGAVILDTCGLLWLAEGGRKFSPRTFKEIQSAPLLFVCAVSVFEIALKVNLGKLKLPAPVPEWLSIVMNNHGLIMMDLDVATCIRAAGLPLIHADPIDRFIIAAAKIHDFAVVTSDERFAEYGIPTLI